MKRQKIGEKQQIKTLNGTSRRFNIWLIGVPGRKNAENREKEIIKEIM